MKCQSNTLCTQIAAVSAGGLGWMGVIMMCVANYCWYHAKKMILPPFCTVGQKVFLTSIYQLKQDQNLNIQKFVSSDILWFNILDIEP